MLTRGWKGGVGVRGGSDTMTSGGGTLSILGPVPNIVLTGNKKGVWYPQKVLSVRNIVLTGKKKGGWSPKK